MTQPTPTKPTKQTKVRLVLEFDKETGKFTMNGPVQNQVLCYGMLGMAAETVAKANAGAPEMTQQPVPEQPAPAILRKNGDIEKH